MTTFTEQVGFVEGPAGPLFCVETAPSTHSPRAIVLSGGGWMGSSTNRNAVLVRMSRAIAGAGMRAARFDWRGTGESAGSVERFDLDQPFFDDVAAIARHLLDSGSTSVAVSGICFGAWSALLAADQEAGVDQVILISLPFPSDMTKADHKTDRIALDSAFRMAWRRAVWSSLATNPAMRQATIRALRRKLLKRSGKGTTIPGATTADAVPLLLGGLVKRGVKVDLIFGEQDLEYASFRSFTGQVELPPGIAVRVIPGDLSNFGTLAAQEAAIGAVLAALEA